MEVTLNKISLIIQSRVSLFFLAVLIYFASAALAYSGGHSGGNKSVTQQFFTTSPDGSKKRQKHFDSRAEVYFHTFIRSNRSKLHGQNGDYVYQVTSPNGRVLLSSDPAECRIVRVRNGVIVNQLKPRNGNGLEVRDGDDHCQTQNSPDGIAGNSQHHDTNTDTYSNNDQALTVQLMPFHETTSRNNAYKVWLTPWRQYLRYRGDPFAQPTPICSTKRRKQECKAGDEVIGFAKDVGFRRHSRMFTHKFKVASTSGNRPPIADAGVDQSASLLSNVTLNGSGSSDPDGNPLSFNWSIIQAPAGSVASLSDNTASSPSFTIDVAGDYTVSLVVNDGTVNSSADNVTISTLNSAPTAVAGTDQSKAVNETVTLDGSASSDDDGDQLSYSWQIVAKPASSSAELLDANSISPSFILDASGSYEIELIVSDGQLNSSPSKVTISTSNSAPIAEAGQGQSATIGTVIMLDASESSDIDGDALSYLWSVTDRPDNSLAELSDDMAVRPEFTLDKAGSYTFQLIASDGQLDSVDTVTITTENSTPVANAGDDQSATITTLINLDGSGSTDVDGDALTYTWSLISVPLNSMASLTDPMSAMPSFSIDVAGDFVAQLTVSDGIASSVDTILISFLNTAPVAEAGPAQSAVIGSTVNLDGSGSGDVDGDSLEYSWALTSKPEESNATLSNQNTVSPSFVIDVSGDYVIQLMVNDEQASSIDTVTVSTLNSAPVADAGEDLTIHVGQELILDGSNSSDADGSNLEYNWSLLSQPDGSNAIFMNADTSMPSLATDLVGLYIAQLIVNDGTADSEPDTVSITTENTAPSANAGADKRVPTYETVELDGSGSFDSDSDNLTYRWKFSSQPNGSSAVIEDETSVKPKFFTDVAGDYVIELIVNDGVEDSLVDTVTITSGNILTLSLSDQLVGVGRTTTVTATLVDQAPAGGQSISLLLEDETLAELNPETLNFAEGETSVEFTVTGLLPGQTVLTGSGAGVLESTANVTITDALVSIGQIDKLAIDEKADLVVSITEPAPVGGVTVQLSIIDSSIATLSAPSVFIPENESTSVVEVMGASFGTTTVSATAVGYAADVGDVTVVLASSFDKVSVAIDAPLKGEITITLADAAPVGGVTFNLSTDDSSIVDFTNEPVTIPEGETQSQPIELRGLSVGSTTLRASASNATDATAEITVDATIEAYLLRAGRFRTTEALIGVDLQDRFQVRLGATPLTPVNITVSVPEDSGVLLTRFRDAVGSNTVVFENVTSAVSQFLYIQGTDIGDDIELTIDITEADTGYFLLYAVDQVTVDVDPSGLTVNNADTTTNSFASNPTTIRISTVVLYDEETPAKEGERLLNQAVRGGFTLKVPMQTSDASVVSFQDGQPTGMMSIVSSSGGSIKVDPDSVGQAIISIASYPNGFSDPVNLDGEVVIDVLPAKVFLSLNGNNQTTEAVVGVDLQARHYLSFEGTPPRAVDVVVSVPDNSGVLLSNPTDSFTSTALGQNSIMVVSNSRNLGLPRFYIQGVTLGDEVNLTIEVFEAGTTIPIGYDVQSATVDVDPSGIYISTQGFTRTLPDATSARVQASTALLHDGEGSVESGKYRGHQQLRGGAEMTIPVLSSEPDVVALPANSNIVMTGGLGHASIFVDPIGPGTSTLSIDPAAVTLSIDGLDLPASFVKPSDRPVEVDGTVNGIADF